MKHLKTIVSNNYVKSMVNSGDLCLLNNVFPGFHISGVCSVSRSFNRILH